jgi:uncharacterized protein YbjQ (UPF0145 family)
MATDTLATISLSKEKQSSMDRFLAKGFPTNKWEEWKYTSLKSLNDIEWNWNTSEQSTNSAALALENTCEIQTQNGKMLYRGMHQNKKKELMEKMVSKAEELGASALVDVKYSVYSTKEANGYQFTGKAVRYVVK